MQLLRDQFVFNEGVCMLKPRPSVGRSVLIACALTSSHANMGIREALIALSQNTWGPEHTKILTR